MPDMAAASMCMLDLRPKMLTAHRAAGALFGYDNGITGGVIAMPVRPPCPVMSMTCCQQGTPGLRGKGV